MFNERGLRSTRTIRTETSPPLGSLSPELEKSRVASDTFSEAQTLWTLSSSVSIPPDFTSTSHSSQKQTGYFEESAAEYQSSQSAVNCCIFNHQVFALAAVIKSLKWGDLSNLSKPGGFFISSFAGAFGLTALMWQPVTVFWFKTLLERHLFAP